MREVKNTITVGELVQRLANCSEDTIVYFEEASSTNRWVKPITSVLYLADGDGCGSEEHVILRYDRYDRTI